MPHRWGQLLMVGLPGQELDATGRYLIDDLQVGGIILFKRNIGEAGQVAALIRDCQNLALAAHGYPLLVAVDQEGGPVQRFRQPFPEMPSARQLGQAGDPEAVAGAAQQVGRELRAIGVTVNLAPVLDVAGSPTCPLWERSYSADPAEVARFGLAAIRGYLAGGVLPVAKHFPGLGETQLDSHLDLPTSSADAAQRDRHLLPFRRAVAAQVPGVMAAHVIVPQWDDLPASLSPVAIGRILRGQLGFRGLSFTDDLEMGAIAKHWPVGEAAALAVAAGHDVLLICEHLENIESTLAILNKRPDLEENRQAARHRLMHVKRRLMAGRTGSVAFP